MVHSPMNTNGCSLAPTVNWDVVFFAQKHITALRDRQGIDRKPLPRCCKHCFLFTLTRESQGQGARNEKEQSNRYFSKWHSYMPLSSNVNRLYQNKARFIRQWAHPSSKRIITAFREIRDQMAQFVVSFSKSNMHSRYSLFAILRSIFPSKMVVLFCKLQSRSSLTC